MNLAVRDKRFQNLLLLTYLHKSFDFWKVCRRESLSVCNGRADADGESFHVMAELVWRLEEIVKKLVGLKVL